MTTDATSGRTGCLPMPCRLGVRRERNTSLGHQAQALQHRRLRRQNHGSPSSSWFGMSTFGAPPAGQRHAEFTHPPIAYRSGWVPQRKPSTENDCSQSEAQRAHHHQQVEAGRPPLRPVSFLLDLRRPPAGELCNMSRPLTARGRSTLGGPASGVLGALMATPLLRNIHLSSKLS